MTRATRIVTWCQPADPAAADLLIVDGRLVGADEAERQSVVQEVNHVAAHGLRTDLPERGWVSDSAWGMVAKVPVQTGDPTLLPSVTVLVPKPLDRFRGKAVRQVVDTAEMAGFRAEAADVAEALAYRRPKKPGLFRRLWQFLFGSGRKG